MVDRISFGNLNSVARVRELETVAKFATGAAVTNQVENPFQGMGLMLGITGAMETYKGGKWLWNNRTDIPGGWAKGMDTFRAERDAQKALLGNGGWKQSSTYKSLWNKYSLKMINEAIPDAQKLAGLDPKTQALYLKAQRAAKLAKENPAHAKKLAQIADKNIAQANAAARAEKLAAPAKGFWGKIGRFFGKITGAKYINSAGRNLAAKSPTVAKMFKYGKGNGLFLGITAALELFTNVIPSFSQLGAEGGIKQLGKSTVKTAASIGGWSAGMAVGAAIGSVIPGAGTIIGGAIGALCGMIGGTIGSYGASKLADKIVGKNELEIAKDKQAAQLAFEASKDPEKEKELLALANQRLEAEGETEDAKVAFTSIKKLSGRDSNATYLASNETRTGGGSVKASSAENVSNPLYAPSTSENIFASQLNFKGMNSLVSEDWKDKDFMAVTTGLA